jgi:ATP-dependent Clp protease ATP-binding subunit ClpB
VLLQILDDGRLTDSHGRTVNFKNTIVIMTSNIGSVHITAGQKKDYDKVKTEVLAEMKQHFRPEFLNRVDETVVFHSLTEADVKAIADIQIARFAQRLTDLRIMLEVNDEARAHIARVGYDEAYGARPLKRVIQREIETPVSKMMISGKLAEGQKLRIGVVEGELGFKAGWEE